MSEVAGAWTRNEETAALLLLLRGSFDQFANL